MSVRETIALAQKLGQSIGENEARVAPVDTNSAGQRAWFGTDQFDRPVAYFEVGDQSLAPFAVSQVIEVFPVSTTIGNPPESVETAKVTCKEPRLDDVFIAFMDEVASQLDTRSSVDVLLSCAAEWRTLLRIAKSGMSKEAATGLYGELRFLEELIVQNGPAAISAWQRDGKDIHDFVGDATSVEVKTSTFQNQHTVTIHGLKQLEPPANGTLWLAVAEVDRHGTGETIDAVVDRILDLGVPLDLIKAKLEAVGFVRGMHISDEPLLLTLRSWRFWPIDKTSPVLTTRTVGEEISTAVSNVRYSLHLGALGEAAEVFDWTQVLRTTTNS